MEEWKTYELSDIADIVTGKLPQLKMGVTSVALSTLLLQEILIRGLNIYILPKGH